jgi:hypothetical protein
VTLVRNRKNGQVFHLSPREKQLLLETLKLYPLVPASHHRLSRSQPASSADENQRLLEESLAEQRAANRRQVEALLQSPDRLREVESGYELTISRGDREWLLQVLNDVRVGSWLALGEPESGEEPEINAQNARFLIALELAGLFETALLAAMGIGESPEWFA